VLITVNSVCEQSIKVQGLDDNMPVKQVTAEVQTDYSGGLNAAENPLNHTQNETPDCANVHSNVFASIEKRKGKAKLNTSAVGATAKANALSELALSTTNLKQVAVWDDGFYKMDGLDGTWDAVTDTLSLPNSRCEIVSYLSKAVIFAHDGSVNPQSWDGSAGATATISGAAAFKYGYADDVTGRLWVCGLAGFEGVTYFSPTNTLSFDTTNDKIQLSSTDTILGFKSLRGRLFGFGVQGWYRIDDLGGNPRYGTRFVAGPGTLSPGSVIPVNIQGVGNVIMYLTPNKQLYIFDGSTTARVSFKFDHRSTFSSAHTVDRMSAALFDEVQAVYWPERNWYMLHYAEDSATSNQNCMVYDLFSKAAFPFTNVACNAATVARTSTGENRLLQAGYTGYAWRADSGNDDDGATIPSHYTLSRKPSEKQQRAAMQKWRQINLTMKATGLFTVDMLASMEFSTSLQTIHSPSLRGTGDLLGTTFVLGTSVLGGSEAVIVPIGIDRLGKYIQIRLQENSTNPAWQLFGDELLSKPVGAY